MNNRKEDAIKTNKRGIKERDYTAKERFISYSLGWIKR